MSVDKKWGIKMKHILMIDPAVSAVNIGDEIISSSIREQISYILKDSFVTNISSHLPLSRNYKIAIGKCDYKHAKLWIFKQK